MRTCLAILLCLALLAACGEEEYGTGTTAGPGAGAYTGLLIDAQRPPDQLPMKTPVEKWQVVDPSGAVIFDNDSIPPAVRSIAPEWEWQRGKTDPGSYFTCRRWLGTNPYIVKIVKDDYPMDENKKIVSATWTVDEATAAELRGLPNLQALLKRGNVMILVGKQGQ